VAADNEHRWFVFTSFSWLKTLSTSAVLRGSVAATAIKWATSGYTYTYLQLEFLMCRYIWNPQIQMT